jgi:hypothetical protein
MRYVGLKFMSVSDDQLTPCTILAGLAQHHRPPVINMYQQRELTGVRRPMAQRAFAEALLGVLIENEHVSRRKFTESIVTHLSTLICFPCSWSFIARRLTAVFTGPPCCFGFQENPGSAAPVQLLLGLFRRSWGSGLRILDHYAEFGCLIHHQSFVTPLMAARSLPTP